MFFYVGKRVQIFCVLSYLNTGSGGMIVLFVKLTFQMSTVNMEQHSFSTHELTLLKVFDVLRLKMLYV